MRERVEVWVPDTVLLDEGGQKVKEHILAEFRKDIPLIRGEDLVVTTLYRAPLRETQVIARWVPATALIDGKREPTPRGADLEPEPRVSQLDTEDRIRFFRLLRKDPDRDLAVYREES